MDPGVRLLVLAAVLLVASLPAHAVEVEEGVRFHMDGGNATVDFAENKSYDTITVREESILFGSWFVSIDHLGDQVLNVTIWNHSLKNLLNGPTLKVETDDAGGEADFEFGDAQQGREYRIERDNTTIDTVEVGGDGRLTWTATELSLPHNFSATLLADLLNVTVRLKGDFNHPNDDVYIDDQQRSTGTYTDSDLDFGYASFELGGKVAGIVPAGTFVQLQFENLASSQRLSQTQQGGDNQFLIPFTEGAHGVIEDRENEIQGSIFGSGNFLGYPSPNFAYELTQEKTVRVTLSYDNIALQGFNDTITQGSYTLIVQNRGEKGGDTEVRVGQQ